MRIVGILSLVATVFLAVANNAGAATTVDVTPLAGPPTASVTVSGKGFDPSTLIDVYFDTDDIALTTSGPAGAVKFTFQVSADAQPGKHWVTLSERRNYSAAQAAFTISVDWPQTGFGPSKRSFNPYENTIGTGNVARLVRRWSKPLDGFSNSKPMIVFNNNIYLKDADQVVRAFSPDGTLLWTASTPFEMFPDALTPAAGFGKVFFSDNNGNVIAYNLLCRTDGGTCTPAWTKNIGSGVVGGLTLRLGTLYAPAADGNVHLINPTTGALGTSIAVSSSGALTTWIAFSADGGGFVGHGTFMAQTKTNTGTSSNVNYSGTLSSPAVGADTAYSTESDAILREMQFSWTTALSGTSCIPPPPAFANGVVFAAGCTSLGAYDAGNGSPIWTITTPSGNQGLAYANGVLYSCSGSRLVAYAASYGGRLWSGGYCSTAPIIVNGMLFSSFSTFSAYSLNGAQSTIMRSRPDPRHLKPDLRLKVSPGQ